MFRWQCCHLLHTSELCNDVIQKFNVIFTEILDYTAIGENVTIQSGVESIIMTVAITDDLRIEENETFFVSLVSYGSDTSIDPENDSAIIAIIDDGCEVIAHF